MSKTAYRSRNQFPTAVTDILDSALKRSRLDKKAEQYSAFPHWRDIVGDDIASVAVPEKIIASNILVVRVIDAVWAQELSLQTPSLLEQIASFGSGACIEDIRFVTGNPTNVKKKK